MPAGGDGGTERASLCSTLLNAELVREKFVMGAGEKKPDGSGRKEQIEMFLRFKVIQ